MSLKHNIDFPNALYLVLNCYVDSEVDRGSKGYYNSTHKVSSKGFKSFRQKSSPYFSNLPLIERKKVKKHPMYSKDSENSKE